MADDRRDETPYVTFALVAAIVAYAWLVTGFLPTDDTLLPSAWSRDAMEQGEWHRLVLSLFAHAGPIHLVMNTVGLLSFGMMLEPVLGRARFAALYVLAGIGGAMLHVMTTDIPAVGASGALFGLIGLVLMLAPSTELSVLFLPMPAVVACSLYLAVVFLVPSFSDLPIAHFGHVGGLLVGMALAFEFNASRGLRNTPYVALVAFLCFAIVAWFRATDFGALDRLIADGAWDAVLGAVWLPLLALAGIGLALGALERLDANEQPSKGPAG